jgi:ubiquinone/menaquinone biosynthesis C-methylase UbiE
MAFTGYPAAQPALTELLRVLKPQGRLVMVDINIPTNGNWRGMALARAWTATGDILRNMGVLFQQHGLVYTGREIGGWGSVHLYVAHKAPAHGQTC